MHLLAATLSTDKTNTILTPRTPTSAARNYSSDPKNWWGAVGQSLEKGEINAIWSGSRGYGEINTSLLAAPPGANPHNTILPPLIPRSGHQMPLYPTNISG
jgi:hypothetical protein